jgi:ADP-ribosylglycohydrolase
MTQTNSFSAMLAKAQGCLLGQLAGDALGSLVEFKSPESIRQAYPDGLRKLTGGGTWKMLAGQPTDDSEMALMARPDSG